MTYAPASITELARYWVAQGGVNSGIVGDAAHRRRASYHNGQDAVEEYERTPATDYSIRLPRDREPFLTNAASALDLGRLKGSLVQLQLFSRWLVERCRVGAPGTEDIREVIYSPDGKVVKRWDNYLRALRDGYPTATGQGDSTHLWHTHLSFYRDSEHRGKVPLFAPYFVSLPDTSTGAAMNTFLVPESPTRVLLKERAPGESVWMYETDAFTANGKEMSLQPNRMLALVGETASYVIVAYEPTGSDANTTSKAMYVRPTDIAKRELVPVVADCTAAVSAATGPLNAQIAALQASLLEAEQDVQGAADAERYRIAEAEAARIRGI